MRQSSKLRRRQRRRQKKTTSGLNLVSLMDIFTILVFFLLINSGDVEVLQVDDSFELPESISERKPEDDTLILVVNREAVILEGRPLVDLQSWHSGGQGAEIQPLAQELAYQASKKAQLSDREKQQGLAVTIMGDKDTPYSLLKSLIKTCKGQNYRDISLAVNQVAVSGLSIAEAEMPELAI